jgi:hypothetical protein
MTDPRPGMPRRIVGFHRDAEGHWVAELDCGHGRHVRHQPPFQERPWTQSAAGRRGMLGVALACRKCLDDPPAGP